MHFLLDPQVLSTLLTLIATGVGTGLVLLFRIAFKVADTHTKVETLWKWWLLHVAKMELPTDTERDKSAGFTAGGGH